MNERLPDLLRRAANIQRSGRTVLGCLLVKARGSTPQSAGALMLVDDTAQTFGTIGGGCVEAEVRRQAFDMLGAGRTGVLRFKLDHDYGWDDGLICGGTIEVAVGALPDAEAMDTIVRSLEQRAETALDVRVDVDDAAAWYRLLLPPRERLYIAGAGHIGQALARLACALEFETVVFDDRADLLASAVADGAEPASGPIDERLTSAPIDEQTYCVIVTRGHRNDARALHAVIDRGARFVGMIGSRRKAKVVFDDLVAHGVSADALRDVESPVGVDIGGISVEEIALSIAARLVEVRRRTGTLLVDGPHPVAETPGNAT